MGVFGVLKVFSWCHIPALRPRLPTGRRNFARISSSFGDLTRDRQTDGRRQTDAATKTEGSHTKCASLLTKTADKTDW